MKPDTASRKMHPPLLALRLALSYALIGAAWILFSDQVLVNLGLPLAAERAFASVKGGAYVVVTSVALYLLTYTMLKSIASARAAVEEQERHIRRAYVDVFAAVTGGKLVLVTDFEMQQALGTPMSQPRSISRPEELAGARAFVERSFAGSLGPEGTHSAALAVGEALTNAVVHAGSGEYQVFLGEHGLQVLVRDQGPGIDFRTLPKAALVPGFSTNQTLGMGFTIMLQVAERVYIDTGAEGTSVVLEFE